METREQSRMYHYCKKLRLNRWDTDDICKFLIEDLKFSSNPSYEHDRLKNKLWKLDILHVANEIKHYLENEVILYDRFKNEYYRVSDELIWEKVYKEIDQSFDDEIDKAKQVGKGASNVGCSVFILMAVMIFFAFLFNL